MNYLPRVASRGIAVLSAIPLLALVLSCASEKLYSGPTLPDDQIATLEVTTPMWLVSVDGQHVSSFSLHDTVRVKILPGSHKVEVSYKSLDTRTGVDQYGHILSAREATWSKANVPITFTARPGYRYVAHPGRIGGADWEPYIIESPPNTNSAAKN
jgi:hypothetical protein